MPDIRELSQKELRRLSRRDLLVLMLDQASQIENLEKALEEERERRVRELKEKEDFFAEKLDFQQQLADVKLECMAERLEYEQKRSENAGCFFNNRSEKRITLGSLVGAILGVKKH